MSVFVSRGDSQRVLYRPVNHMTAGSITTRFQLVHITVAVKYNPSLIQ